MLKLSTNLSVSSTIRARSTHGLRELAPRSCGSSQVHSIVSVDESATQTLAYKLAKQLSPGDTYLLTGPVGAGKSVFSRAFIRSAYEDDFLPVPSPTYLLQNIYDELEGPEIHHFDLYRLDNAASLGRLQLEQSFKDAVSLVEWAERLPEGMRPVNRLDIDILPGQTMSRPANEQLNEDRYFDARQREIRLMPHGEAMIRRCQQLFSEK